MVADQQFIALVGQIALGVSTVFLTIFKYREVLSFGWKLLQLLWKPVKCVIDWIKLAHKIEAAQIKSDEKVSNLEDTLAKLDKFMRDKLSPNGGSSFADAIKRIEARQIVSDSRQTALLNDSKAGVFFCDLHGNNSWVNRTYARFLDCGTNELVGFGWRKFIKTEELSRYSKIWEAAFRDGCEFEDTVEFVNAHGQKVAMHISVSSVMNELSLTTGYVGQVIAL
jgi:PAS domain S-box-containing protein